MQIHLHTPDIIFGIHNSNKDIILDNLNFCILFAKSFIYNNKKVLKEIHLDQFHKELQKRLDSEKLLLNLQGKSEYFLTKWQMLYNTL